MTDATRDLLERALQLPPADRAVLVTELVVSLDVDEPEDGVEAAWAEEIERRVREMPPPGTELSDADEVFARLRRHLGERRLAR